MDLESARVTEHAGKNLQRSAAHNGIFYYANTLVLEHTLNGVKLEFDFLFTNILRGVNKGAAHIVVTKKPNLKADTAGLGIAKSRGGGTVGHRNHDVGVNGAFLRQLLAHLAADLVATLFKNLGIRTAEVDVLEDTMRETVLVGKAFGVEAVLGDGQEFARLDIANVVRSQKVKGAGLRGHAPGLAHTGYGKRTEAEAIAGHIHGVLADEHEAEAARKFRDGLLDGFAQVISFGAGDFVKQNFGVGGGLENVTLAFHLGPEFVGVGDVAVVGYRKLAPLATHQDGLGVGQS